MNAAPHGDPSPDVLRELRSATRAAHASIETVPAFSRLLRTDLSAAAYLRVLQRLHGFLSGIEPALASALRGRSGAGRLLDGASAAALARDIEWFGGLPLSPWQPPRAPACPGEALGALYVLEGSNLGARVIGRHVSQSLGITAGAGGAFHCGFADACAARRWQWLQATLRSEVDASGAAFAPVVSAALATFGALEAWMREDADSAPQS